MKEYNWREERKKYQADFRKEEPAAPQPAVAPAPAPAAPAPGSKFPLNAVIILAVAIVAAAAIFAVVLKPAPQPSPAPIEKPAAGKVPRSLPDQPSASEVAAPAAPAINIGIQDSATKLYQQAEKHKYAVGVATAVVELKNGEKLFYSVGTAWAFAPNKFATNVHVVRGIKEAIRQYREKYKDQIKYEDAVIVINGAAGESYSVTHIQEHRNYGRVDTKVNPDVAVMTIQGHHTSYFKIAEQDKLYALKSGLPVAFLGFPMENLSDNNLNLDSPVATMQTGIVVAVSDFYLKDSGVRNNQLIRHNLPSTGGASGSPIFDINGEVVALLYAGHIVGQAKFNSETQTLQISNAPSAVQINFGVRSDLLRGVGNKVALRDYLR